MVINSGLFQKKGYKRFVILAVLILLLYLLRSMLDLFLLTFIFTYLMYRIQGFLSSRLRRIVRVQQRILVVFLYILLICGLVFGLYRFVPELVQESSQVVNQIYDFYKQPPNNPIVKYLMVNFKQIDIGGYIKQGFDLLIKSISSVGRWGFNFLIALILSLYFLLEKNRVIQFTARFESSNVGDYYHELKYLGEKFLRSFGVVIETQIMIAFINGILSVIALWIMGFPQVLSLGIMIFVLGLIPVAGVIISLIPLSMIAFKIGGLNQIVYVLIMIVCLHSLESYVLNPRLMSSKTKLPVFYTLIVLIVAEHFLGVWGLIIGIPIFMFLLEVMEFRNEG